MKLTNLRSLLPVIALVCVAMTIATPGLVNASGQAALVQDGVDGILKDLALEAFKKSLGPGGELISNASAYGIDPLVDAATTRGTARDKTDAWLKAMAKAGVEAAWPAYGFAVKGGQIVLGSFRGGIEDLIESLQDDQNRAILFGKIEGGFLDRLNNVMADTPFIENTGVRGLTADNLGELVTTETKLKEQWDFYVRRIKDLYGASNADTVSKNWPRLLNIWRMQRAAIVLADFTRNIDREMAIAIKTAKERAAAGDTGSKGPATKDAGPPPAPVPGTFGPPTKKLGHAAPPAETANGRTAGTMSERAVTILMSTTEPKGSSKVDLKWTGDLPAILKPGDVITLKTSVEATRSGPDAPNAWGNANWVVSGSVKILSEKKTFAGTAGSGAFIPSDTGELKFEVLSGGSINIYTRFLGSTWGSSDNWTPAEYNYTFTPPKR